jgi:hypothetical protein
MGSGWLGHHVVMRIKLNWVDVLNEQAHWRTRSDVIGWFCALVGKPAHLLDGSIDGFEEALLMMRTQLANLHFGEEVDLLWLDTQLKTVSLGLLHLQGAQEGSNSHLPHFRARVKGMHDSDLLRAVKDTLLIQFAEFIGSSLDFGQCQVSRCEGFYDAKVCCELSGNGNGHTGNGHTGNGNGNGHTGNGNGHTGNGNDHTGNGNGHNGNGAPAEKLFASKFHKDAASNAIAPISSVESEERWRNELPLLAAYRGPQDLRRCANLFAASGKTRFCSDACRFATFQLAKQMDVSTPASKSRRVKRRQEKQEVVTES